MTPPAVRFAALLAACAAPLAAASITVEMPSQAPRGSLEVAIYGRGLCMQSLPIEATTAVDLDALAAGCLGHDFRPIDEIRLALLLPGHAVATFAGGAIDATWIPDAVALPVWRLAGRIEPPPGEPSRLKLRYPVRAMLRFFEYFDGGVPELLVGETTVAEDGSFELPIADLRNDPFLAEDPHEVVATVSSGGDRGRRGAAPAYRVPLARLYDEGELVLGAELAWPLRRRAPE
jgi:hypothetical protein